MRNFFILIVLVGFLAGIDAVAFGGHYRHAVWHDAKYQADQFNNQIQDWLRMVGL